MKLWSAEAGAPEQPLVVLIHGAMDRSASMVLLSRRLDQRCRVLRYDRRGYGHSAAHPGPFTMAAHVADVITLLAGRPAVLVGHSYGGNVAMAAAAEHDLVVGVAIYESPLPWEPFWPPPHDSTPVTPTGAEATGDAAEAFMRRLIGDRRWEALPERTRRSRRAEGAALVAELADLRERRPWKSTDIRVPVMVGVGSLAAERYQHGMAHVASNIAGAELVRLDGGGHNAPATDPDQFCEQLIDPLLRRVGWR